MDLKDYYRLLLRNLPIVIATTLLGTIIAGLYSFLATPVYEAKIQLFVSTPSSALDISALVQGSSFSQQRVKSYAQVINGPETLNPVINQLHLNITADKLAKKVIATAPLDTVLINVTVSNTDPVLAANIANAIGRQFSSTANTLESSDATAAGSIKVTMVKSAVVPSSPSSPKKGINIILGFILGLGLGTGLSILRQIFDNTVKNEEHLGDVPLLAAIAFDNDAIEKPLVTSAGRYAARTEAFRQMRTNLQFIRGDNPPKVLAITSAMPGEGKTTSAINLAIMFAQAGKDTLLVEADLRRPRVSEYLGRESLKKVGLTQLLNGELDVEEVKDLEKTMGISEIENLTVMSTGKIPPNPSELLNSPRFARLVEILREQFEYVIFDCPPLLPVSDAAIISTKTDGTILIIRAGSTRIAQFKGSYEAIVNVGSSVLGAVLNMIPLSRDGEDYGYRYGYSYGYKNKYGSYGSYSPIKKIRGMSGYAPAGYAPRSENKSQSDS
jgi:non-specific protein-tyrosine kinase